MHIIARSKSSVACDCQTITLWTDCTWCSLPPSSAQITVLAHFGESCVIRGQKLHHCPGVLSSQQKDITKSLGNFWQPSARGLLGLLQLLVLAPGSSYLYTVLCMPNPSIVLLISLLSKDTVSVHGFLEAPLKVWLGELMTTPSVSALQSKETWPRHKSQAWGMTGVSPSAVQEPDDLPACGLRIGVVALILGPFGECMEAEHSGAWLSPM